MKYYVVSDKEIVFKQDDRLVVPSKEVVEQNIANMFDGKNSFLCFDKIEDAIRLANEYNPDKKAGEEFLVFEVEAPKRTKKDAELDLRIDEDNTEILEGFDLKLKNATFVQAHLGHSDPALKGCRIQINMKGTDILKKVDALTKAEQAIEVNPAAASRRRTALKGVLVTGALAAVATAAMVCGLTPALLAFAGIKLGFAATLVASALISTVAITAAYSGMKGASKFKNYVASKRNAAAGVAKEDVAEDAAKVEANKDAVSELKPADETPVEDVVKQAEAVNSNNVLKFSGAPTDERKENTQAGTQANLAPESETLKKTARI